MPIVFDQPGPYDPNISRAYGNAQALKDFLPFLQRSYGGGGGSGGGGGGGIYNREAGGGPGVRDAGFVQDPVDMYRARVAIDSEARDQERERQIEAIREMTGPEGQSNDNPTTGQGADYNLANEDLPYGGTTPQGRAQAQPPEFTQGDQLQLSRLQASQSRVNGDLMNGQIDPGTARRMIAQLRTGIDPLRMQQQAAASQMQQMQLNQEMQQVARQTAMQNMNAAAWSAHVREHTVDLGNGNSIYTDPLGKPHIIKNERMAAEMENAHQVAQHDQHEDTAFRTALEHVEKAVLGGSATTAPREATEADKKRIAEMMQARGFSSANLAEHQTARAEFRARPFTPETPAARLAPFQQQRMQEFDQTLQRGIESAPGYNTETFRSNLSQAREIFQRAGSVRRMSSEQRERYIDLLRRVQNFIDRGQGARPASSPPADQRPAGPLDQSDLMVPGL